MSSFKTASVDQRESQMNQRSQKGLSYVKADIPIFVPSDGDNQIRIVPPLSDDKHASLWGLEVWAYYMNNRSFLSSKTFDQTVEDPIQNHFFDIRQEADEQEKKKYRATKRHLMFVLDLNDEKEELKLWAAPPTLVDGVLNLTKNRRTGELIPLEDPKLGRIVFFTKTGQGIGTKYDGIELDSQPFPLDEALADELDLFENILEVPQASELQAILTKMLTGEPDDQEAIAPPRRAIERSRPSNRTNTPAPENVPQEEPEQEPQVDEDIPDEGPSADQSEQEDLSSRVRKKLAERAANRR
jgi:hypothetical protein